MFYDRRKMKDYGFSCTADLLKKGEKRKRNGWVGKGASLRLREKFTKISRAEKAKEKVGHSRRAMKILNRIHSKLFYVCPVYKWEKNCPYTSTSTKFIEGKKKREFINSYFSWQSSITWRICSFLRFIFNIHLIFRQFLRLSVGLFLTQTLFYW